MLYRIMFVALLAAVPGAAQNVAPAEAAPPAQSAAPVQAAPAEAQPQAEPEVERKICRTEQATGSLTRRTRICMTRSEWAELGRNTGQGVTDMARQASGSQCIPSDPMAGGRC